MNATLRGRACVTGERFQSDWSSRHYHVVKIHEAVVVEHLRPWPFAQSICRLISTYVAPSSLLNFIDCLRLVVPRRFWRNNPDLRGVIRLLSQPAGNTRPWSAQYCVIVSNSVNSSIEILNTIVRVTLYHVRNCYIFMFLSVWSQFQQWGERSAFSSFRWYNPKLSKALLASRVDAASIFFKCKITAVFHPF